MGVKNIVRLGTTGSLTKDIPMYSFIATIGALRHDGTSDHYLPIGVVAVPDKNLHCEIVRSLKMNRINVREGISYTTSTRFKEDVSTLLELNKKDKVLNIEMESATLFAVSDVLNMKSASISMVTDCLANEGELENVEGTLVGVPKYQNYFDKGLTALISAFDAILSVFSLMPANNPIFTKLQKRLISAKESSK
jgi:uridine phosphorylase